jgi:FtsP/CotA-like multicopper oxidase with cupredoxin domain
MDTTTRIARTIVSQPAAGCLLTPRPRGRLLSPRPAATAAIALCALLPSSLPAASPPGDSSCVTQQELQRVGVIESKDHRLQAVIKVVSGPRYLPQQTDPKDPLTLRYYEGYNPADSSQKWPNNWDCVGPGPTLRAQVGDVVQITFLNQISPEFANSIDSGHRGSPEECDQFKNVSSGKYVYPVNDKYPNCFHGSSSANIHFHGTHVTPSTTGDNILIALQPNSRMTERDLKEVERSFKRIFEHCELREEPKKWADLPERYRELQRKWLNDYDNNAPYQGGRGLPRALRVWPKDEAAIHLGLWPQYFSGAYPYCFQIPEYAADKEDANVKMGQAPGTHWYHSHKHGSTALNLFNGLGGAFIIADDRPTGYDGKLDAFYKPFYPDEKDWRKSFEKILVLQQISEVLNLTTPQGGGPPRVLVNGQLAPTITMRPGQVQLWRIVNATVQKSVNLTFNRVQDEVKNPPAVAYRQTAQDGVQFSWKNFSDPQNGTAALTMAPANRVDLLVQAPASGTFLLGSTDPKQAMLKLVVSGGPYDPPMGFPTAAADYPVLPPFLKDIDPAEIRQRREITYGSYTVPNATQPLLTQLQFTIDGKQFEDHKINQVMELGTSEEWTVYNADTIQRIAHPFHIHVNPFQIVEVFDPSKALQPRKFLEEAVWWDTFAIPPPVALLPGQSCPSKVVEDANKTRFCVGYFKMRTRFVDFTGQYVQHCHILAHEDRGMMQLLEVVPDTTPLGHH